MIQLDEVEARVLGVLVEKDMATPEYYPMSLNAVTNGCNQKSNRDPVVNYDDHTVSAGLESLRAIRLASILTGGENRVPKHSHRASETLDVNNRELSVLCVLMLRGPQTVGELKGRTERLYSFDDLDAVENCLQKLAERGMVVQLARQSGMREARWAHLFSGEPSLQSFDAAAPAATVSHGSLADRVAQLEGEVESLKAQFAEFRKQFE